MFVCLHFPHFGAWALAQSDPALASKPFAVCEHGHVVAPSPLAVASGIEAGMSLGKASARLDSLVVAPRDKSCEALAWHEVQRTLYGLTPKIEAMECGHLFCEVAPQDITRLLHHWNGTSGIGVPTFGVTAGSAGDRSTAHLAALHAPSGACRGIKRGRDWHFAGAVPLTALGGLVAKETIERLMWFGWTTLGALRPLSRRQLEEQFDAGSKSRNGSKGFGRDGAVLFRLAQGARCRDNLRPIPTWHPPEEITARIAFEFPATQPSEWNQGLVDILIQACRDLGARSARTLEITVQTPIAPLGARRVLREPSSNPKTLLMPLQSALEEALHLAAPLPLMVQGFEIRLGALTVPESQTALWPDPASTRQKNLHDAVENIESRLPAKILTLTPRQPHSPFEEEVWGWASALEKLREKKLGDKKLGARRHAAAKR